MNVSRRWLEAFLGRDLDARDAADRLAMLCAPVDAVEPLHPGLEEIVVARVAAVARHPHADRLSLCEVDDGSGTLQHVVCGAPNVRAGARYPFARIGATLPGGLRIERRKIRGEASEGMLCSARELGLGEDHDGILELEGEATPGTRLVDALSLGDHRLLLDVTPNRPDLLGHKGVARELAAAYGTRFRLPVLPGAELDLPAFTRPDGPAGDTGGISVRINDRGCGRFVGAVVKGVRVGRSPGWLRARLEAVGVRSISNVVDATNYVMLELNQPMHAYDLATLRGGVVAARNAAPGERVVTLDGVSRAAPEGALVIADAGRAIGFAGVMGGAETEVSDATTDLFLECAWFEPLRVRAARKALGLSTEASFRFERGIDKWNAPEAMRRGLELILRNAGGTVAGSPIDVWPEPGHPPRVFLRLARVAQVLGVELPLHSVEQALVSVGATVVAKPDDGRLAVEVPGWRPDLIEEIDLIEEVGRRYGYDRIPSELAPCRPGSQRDDPAFHTADRVRDGLSAAGLCECITLPMGAYDARAVALLNPLSADQGRLRPSLLPGLVREVERNWSTQLRDVRLFEVGTVFAPANGGARPREQVRAGAVVTGGRRPPHWTSAGKTADYDRWDLKGLLEVALSLANASATVQVAGPGWIAADGSGAQVGWAGPLDADAPRWAGPLFGLEVVVGPGDPAPLRYRPFPVTPAVARDLALLVPDATAVATLLEGIHGSAGALLESVVVLDQYRGPGVPPGRRSVAVRLVFRADDRTLRDEEVDRAVQTVCQTLERGHDVVLRTA